MKHVLITGGSDGLGKATAQKLVAAGFKVTILSRNEGKTKAAAGELGCEYVIADVSNASEVETAIQRAVTQSGEIDILINNAGVWLAGPLEANTPDDITATIVINTLGTIYCTRAVVGSMKQRKSGRIINISSILGVTAKAERATYAASKWAVTGFTRSMQAELKPYKIGVTGFYPGGMTTGMFAKVGDMKDRSTALDPAIAADQLVHICMLPNSVDVPDFGIQSLDY